MYISSTHRTKLVFAFQIFCTGFFLLILLELLIFWMAQPGELLTARGVSSHFATFFLAFTHISFLYCLVLLDIIVLAPASLGLLQPLTLLRYLSLIKREAREEHLFYFDLTALTLLTPDNTHASTLHESHPNERVSILELVHQQ